MSKLILSVVIPTFNRAASLASLLQELELVYKAHSDIVQIVVCDNRSTDDTPAIVAQFASGFGNAFKYVTRPANTGIEGNITGAMMEGDGKYVWVLSDHQRLRLPAVIDAIERMKSIEFDVGHAKLAQWPPILSRQNEVVPWSALTGRQRGALVFQIGNISAMLFRRDLALDSAKAIFQACGWSYPNLGLISKFTERTRIVEFQNLSALPESKDVSKFVSDYDKIGVCFRAHIEVVRIMARRAGVTLDERGFFGPTYRHAFRGNVMNLMRMPASGGAWSVAKRLWPVIAINPWGLKLTAIFVIASFAFTPVKWRVAAAGMARQGDPRPAPAIASLKCLVTRPRAVLGDSSGC